MSEFMRKKYDLALFDVDGTLLDTSEGVLQSAKYAIEQTGLPMPDEKTLLSFIGPPIQESFQRIFGITGAALDRMTNLFRNSYSTDNLLKAMPYRGIYELLDVLVKNHILVAIATYKREDYALKIIDHFGFARYSFSSHGADAHNRLRKSDIIEQCIRECNVGDKARAVMIGDTMHDAEGAKRAGVDFIGVTWGFGYKTRAEVMASGAVGSAENPSDIVRVLLEDTI